MKRNSRMKIEKNARPIQGRWEKCFPKIRKKPNFSPAPLQVRNKELFRVFSSPTEILPNPNVELWVSPCPVAAGHRLKQKQINILCFRNQSIKQLRKKLGKLFYANFPKLSTQLYC